MWPYFGYKQPLDNVVVASTFLVGGRICRRQGSPSPHASRVSISEPTLQGLRLENRLAGVAGFEPTSAVLETGVLPLDYTPV